MLCCYCLCDSIKLHLCCICQSVHSVVSILLILNCTLYYVQLFIIVIIIAVIDLVIIIIISITIIVLAIVVVVDIAAADVLVS